MQAAGLPKLIENKQTAAIGQACFNLTPEEKLELADVAENKVDKYGDAFGDDSETPDRTVEKPVSEEVSKTALNGAQVTSMQGIIQAVASEQLPAEAAKLLLTEAFPAMSVDAISRMVKSAEKFTPAAPEQKPKPVSGS